MKVVSVQKYNGIDSGTEFSILKHNGRCIEIQNPYFERSTLLHHSKYCRPGHQITIEYVFGEEVAMLLVLKGKFYTEYQDEI